jgi:Stress responsive A/B Barrel Domain
MVFHMLLFQPRPGLADAERQALVAALEAAVRAIPSIRRCHVGRRVRHGAGYEALSGEAFDYAAVLEFDDLAGLGAYLDHPAHADLGPSFLRALERSCIVDYEMVEGTRASDLVR